MRCFSCGRPIAHQWDVYLESQKGEEKKEQTPNSSFRALANLHVGRSCCRRMFLCQQDMYHKIT